MSEPRTAPIDAASPPATSAALAAHPGDVLYDFVSLLLARSRTMGAPISADVAAHHAANHDERLAELQLAEAALRLHLARDPARQRPVQLAVFGPTQVGKSTVVNLLIGTDAAAVSPLAGYTIHAEAFAVGPRRLDAAAALPERLFPHWARVPRSALLRDQLESFAFEFVPPPPDPAPPPRPAELWSPATGGAPGVGALDATAGRHAPGASPRVVWDTPDFDSLAARHYQRAVLEVAAAADLLVLVVSKEKYADLSVWRTLRLLAPLGPPLVVVLNKLAPQTDAIVRSALAARLREFGGAWGQAPIVSLAYCAAVAHTEAGDERSAWRSAGRAALEQAIESALPAVPGARPERRHATRAAAVVALLKTHWDSWTAPLEAEHAAAREFHGHAAQTADRILAEYRRDYLDHPQRYDAFRRASAELLQLLELPGLAGALTQVRHVVTWPARQLVRAGRTLWERARARPGDTAAGAALARSSGALVLQAAADAQLVTLERMLLLRGDERGATAAWWRALRQRLAAQREDIRAEVRYACETLEPELQAEIQAAARELFELLRQRPALLNTLRAARVTADVAGVAVAIKTGGAGLHDLLYAPAMLAFSSLLTEGALGSYIGQVAENLKKRQFAAARRTLIDERWRPRLLRLTEGLSAPGVYGVGAPALTEAHRALADFTRLAAPESQPMRRDPHLGGSR